MSKKLTHTDSIQKLIDRCTISMPPGLEQFYKQNNALANAVRGIQFPALDTGRRLAELMKPAYSFPDFSFASKWTDDLTRASRQYADMMKPFTAQAEMLKQQMSPIFAQANRLEEIARGLVGPSFIEFARSFTIPTLSPDVRMHYMLKSRYWVVMDEAVIQALCELDNSNEDAREAFLIKHFTQNGWAAVAEKMELWGAHPFMAERMPILRDTLQTIKKLEQQDADINPFNVALPTLLAQMDGLRKELIQSIPEQARRKAKLEMQQAGPKKKKIDQNELLANCISELIDAFTAFILADVILEGVFKHGRDMEPDDEQDPEYEFNILRNGILHGDKNFLDYGTRENTVRVFLYLDFLIQIIAEVTHGQRTQTAA